MKTIAVFGSSRVNPGDEDYEAAVAVGAALAQAGYAVMTGGYSGIMEAASKGAKEAGGHVIGVTTGQIETVRIGAKPNQWVIEHIMYPKLEARLDHLLRKADGYVVMSGGVGTLAELALAWEYMHVKEIPVRPIVCYGALWNAVMTAFLDDRFIAKAHQRMVRLADAPEQVIEILGEKPTEEKWIYRD